MKKCLVLIPVILLTACGKSAFVATLSVVSSTTTAISTTMSAPPVFTTSTIVVVKHASSAPSNAYARVIPQQVSRNASPLSGRIARASWYTCSWCHGGFASTFLKKGTWVTFCANSKCVRAVDDDYGPASWTGRTFDLDADIFQQLAPLSSGVITVSWTLSSGP